MSPLLTTDDFLFPLPRAWFLPTEEHRQKNDDLSDDTWVRYEYQSLRRVLIQALGQLGGYNPDEFTTAMFPLSDGDPRGIHDLVVQANEICKERTGKCHCLDGCKTWS